MQIGSFNPRELIDTIRWRRERLGLFLDGRATRIVKVKRAGNKYRVTAFTQLDLDLMHASSLEKQRFKLAVKQVGEGLTRVAVNAEHPSLRVRRMSFPKMPEKDILEAIRWNFREHIEGNIENYIVGYTPLEEVAEDGRSPIIAYGLSSEAIDDYTKVLKSLGLKPVSLEPAASALLTAFHVNGVLDDGRRHVCVSFGDQMTLFSVMRGNSVLFCRPLPGINHEALARLVMRNLNLETEKARKALDVWGAGASDGKPKSPEEEGMQRNLETTIGHFFSQLVIEMQRSIDAFCIMYGVDKVDAIHVCGNGVNYPGLIDHMGRNLGIETKIFNPFSATMDAQKQTDRVKQIAPFFAVAVGLAIP